jgi:hypothetical protein
MSFAERKIDLTFDLAEGQFGGGLGKSAKVSGLRCEVSINNMLGESLNTVQLRVFGMSESRMNQMSTLGIKPGATPKNIVTIEASNNTGGMTQAFQGTMANAWVDYRGAPEVSFNVEAWAGAHELVKPIAVNSYKGTVDVATIIESLAKGMGFGFTNNGVTAKLSNPYFAGSAVSQIKECAQHAGIAYDISNGVVNIWPSGGTRDDVTFLLSPETGLVGYPTFSSTGLQIQAEYNPLIFNGRKFQVQSAIPQACGKWYCQIARHELASQTPNGPWFTYAKLVGEGYYVSNKH